MKNKYLTCIRACVLFALIATGLISIFTCSPGGREKENVISNEALLKLDSRMRFSSFVNNSPGDGMDAEVNPPRFRWYYVPNPLDMPRQIKPYRFRFQVADNEEFTEPVVNVETEINFYNELPVFPDGKKYFWRVGYIPYGEKEPVTWTRTFSINIPSGTPQWDRSALRNPDFGGHPRLLFKKAQLEELKKLAASSPIFQADIIGAAERMRQNKWWNNWPKTDLDKPEYTYGFYFQLCRELAKTAFAYLITGDEKYQNVLDIWTTIASYPKGGASSPEGMGVGAETEDNTSITEYLACVYDWFYDVLSPEQRAVFEKSLEWRINEWMYNFRWGGAIYTGGSKNPMLSPASIAITGQGHSWEGALDTFAASIALYEKSPAARDYFHWIANYIISVGEKCAQNGGYDLGAHYGQSHMKWLVYQLMYFNGALPELSMGKNPLYRQYGEFFMGLVPVGMKYSHFGRIGSHGAGVEMRKEVFNLLAYLTGSGEILNNWLNDGEKKRFSWRPWIHIAAPLHFNGELKPVPSTQTKFLFPATGFVMAHRYPPDNPRAFKEGVGVIWCCRPNRGDNYNNENAFQIYAYGQHCNYGGHSGDENPYGFQTIAHNTIMVDGIGQTITEESQKAGYRGVLMAYKEGNDYTYWMGDATNAYPRRTEIANTGGWSAKSQIDYDDALFGEKGAPKLERFRRHMLFMRDKYLVVYDDLKTAPERPSRFSWRYRVLDKTDAGWDAQDGLLTYSLDDVKILIKHIAFPESIEFTEMNDLDQFINPVTGNNYLKNNEWTSLDMKNPRYRSKVCYHNFWFTTTKPASDFYFLTVIYPVEPGTKDPIITRLDDNTVKVEKDGEIDIISFDKDTKFPATLIVDLDAFRQPVQFGEYVFPSN
ncbi:DUF4962 domain-containing protein [candidate division KSB1 bacterium]|nr:DUF4962 domain-containing protein [candidate division KSB1 bacterium]